MKDDYTRNLEEIIKQMLEPLKSVPLSLVIEGISGCKIVPFDETNERDKELLENLKKVAVLTGRAINKSGIVTGRPNEAGNAIEPFVQSSLGKIGYKADKPLTKGGKKKSAGYPDLEFADRYGRYNYLECKTFNINNVETTFRAFYLSPSKDFKITKDAHHFVMSFEIYEAGKKGKNNIYKTSSWKIMSIEKLQVDVKYEFNCDNKRLYGKHLILAEGRL